MNILKNISLKPYNTFCIDVLARSFVEVTSVADLRELILEGYFQRESPLVMGGGSNVLLVDHYPGLVVRNGIKGIVHQEETEAFVTLRIGAGEVWHDLVLYTLEHGLGGIENLSLIPGTVGAAPMQNIGAYGVEIRDVFESLEAVDRSTGEVVTFDKEQCQFGYRQSVFKTTLKDRFIITQVSLKLSKAPRVNIEYGAIRDTLKVMGITNPTIREVSEAVISIRQSKLPDPEQIGNAGSFFKNPLVTAEKYAQLKNEWETIPGYPEPGGQVKVPAGWLIEQCGWKGKRQGEVGVHARQALVLVNYGQGTGEEIKQLSHQIRASVQQKFDIVLEGEVNIIQAPL